jgi:hypothetical protein
MAGTTTLEQLLFCDGMVNQHLPYNLDTFKAKSHHVILQFGALHPVWSAWMRHHPFGSIIMQSLSPGHSELACTTVVRIAT